MSARILSFRARGGSVSVHSPAQHDLNALIEKFRAQGQTDEGLELSVLFELPHTEQHLSAFWAWCEVRS
jgi:hypothetical protein